jgi:uncharacterized membrane protein YbhN (UPF0104 family)
MVYLCEKEGIARTRTLASILVYQTASVASGLLAAGAVYLLAAGTDSPFGGAAGNLRHGSESGRQAASTFSWANLGLIAAASLVALVVCMPPVMNWGLRQVSRLLHREMVQIELGFGDMVRFFLQRLGIWGLQGLAFAVFVRSVYSMPLTAFPVLGAAYALSWVIGFMSLLTPSGLGVREAAQTALLASVTPLSVSVALALLSRLWLMVGELAGAALGVAFGRLEARTSAQEEPGV